MFSLLLAALPGLGHGLEQWPGDDSGPESYKAVWLEARHVLDEALEVLDLVADSGLDGVVTWLLRLLGLLALLAGVGLWLFAELRLLVPALLVVGGLVLLVAPSVLLVLDEVM